MIGIDTNVLLRLLLDDDAAQSRRIDAWLAGLPAQPGQVLIGQIVLAEALWTLSTLYRQPKAELVKALRGLLAEPMFAFEHRDAVERAVALGERAGCGLVDGLIVAHHQAAGCDGTVTFDRRMRTLPGVRLL